MSIVYIVMQKVSPEKGGGVNRAVRNRSKALVDRGYDVTILTLHDFNTARAEKKLKESGRLDTKVKLLNFYDYFREKNTTAKTTGKGQHRQNADNPDSLEEEGYQIEVDESGLKTWYKKNGIHVKCKKWRKKGTLQFIDYFNMDEKKIAQINFHKDGYITKRKYYNPQTEKLIRILYYTRDEFCYLESTYTEHNNTVEHYLYEFHSDKEKRFTSDAEINAYWLNQLCVKQKEKPFVICDKIHAAPSVINMRRGVAHRIYAIHSNHLTKSHDKDSPIRSSKKIILDNLEMEDRVVILTEKQKQHIIERYGDYGNICVIPHHIQYKTNDKVKKKNKTISIVSRLHPTKQIKHAIEAFQKVIRDVPDAKLNIYGNGEQYETLKNKISELNLSQNVFLKGYATNTDQVYKESLATLLTSRSEAFALVILESMANGTPVISYDVNYGPSDIITDGKDGYLISQDKQLLTDKIIELLNKPRKAQKMGKKARKNVSRIFDERVVIDKWIALFDELKESE